MSKTDIHPRYRLVHYEDAAGFPFRLMSTGYAACQGHERFERSDHQHTTVEFIADGEGVLKTNGHACRPRKGDVYILHKHSAHLYYPDKGHPWTKRFFVVDGQLASQLLSAHGLLDVHHVRKSETLALFEQMARLHKTHNASVHRRAALIFHEIIARLAAVVDKKDSRFSPDVIRVRNFLDEHTEQDVALPDICELVGKSEGHIIRTFKSQLGTTPYDYLLRKRIDSAKFLLANTELTVKEIAHRLRFADPYYFSNLFKRKVGTCPRDFRRKVSGVGREAVK